jgi:hypothetical protein
MLEELAAKKNYATVTQFGVVLLAQLLQNISFGAKKTIIKPIFTKNFIPILEKNPQFIYLFLAFLGAITDKTVFSMTVGKAVKRSLAANPLVTNKTVQHFMYLALSKDIGNIGAIDKKLFLNPALVEFMDVESMADGHLFKENLAFLTRSIILGIDLIPTPAQIIQYAADDQHFSSLMGSYIDHMAKGRLIRREA